MYVSFCFVLQMMTRAESNSVSLFPIETLRVHEDRLVITAVRYRTTYNANNNMHRMVPESTDITLAGLDRIEGVRLRHSFGYGTTITCYTYRACVETLSVERFHGAEISLEDVREYCQGMGHSFTRLRSSSPN